jgi:hypothetical protein
MFEDFMPDNVLKKICGRREEVLHRGIRLA